MSISLVYATLPVFSIQDHAYLNVVRSRSGSLGIANRIVNLNILETTPSGVPKSSGSAYQKPLVWRPHILGLYNGLEWLALGRIFGVGARFGTYELLTAFYKDGRQDNYVYVSEALMAGIAADGRASRVPKSSTALEITSASSSIAKVLRGYTPDVKALNHSVGLLSTLNTIIIKMVSNDVFWHEDYYLIQQFIVRGHDLTEVELKPGLILHLIPLLHHLSSQIENRCATLWGDVTIPKLWAHTGLWLWQIRHN
ncbi:mitochondrial arginine transporter BAC2 [Tanacetum coccineum]